MCPIVDLFISKATIMLTQRPAVYSGGVINHNLSTSSISMHSGSVKMYESSTPNLQARYIKFRIRDISPAPYAVVIAGMNAPSIALARELALALTVLPIDIAAFTDGPKYLFTRTATPCTLAKLPRFPNICHPAYLNSEPKLERSNA